MHRHFTKKLSSAVLALAVLLVGLAPSLAAEEAEKNDRRPVALQGIAFHQRLDAQVPPDITFVDDHGRQVRFGDYFGDKPVILVLAYYRCPMLCNLVLNRLVQGMLEMRFEVGRDFEVVTVSFDPRETWPLAAEKKETYLERYGRAGAERGWHFLTGSPPQIKALTDSVGFQYRYDAEQDLYLHPAGIVVLTPAGKISRYIYDVKYSGRDLRLALVEASAFKIASPVDEILLYCFHYDPQVGRYTASIMNFVRVGGIGLIFLLAAGVWFLSKSRTLKTLVLKRVEQLGQDERQKLQEAKG